MRLVLPMPPSVNNQYVTVNGRPTKAEIIGHQEFAIHRIWRAGDPSGGRVIAHALAAGSAA